MKKRVISMILTVAVILSAVPMVAVSATSSDNNETVILQSSLRFDEVREFSEGLAAVRVGDWDTGKWGFVNVMGEIVIPPIYNSVRSFSEGLAAFGVECGQCMSCLGGRRCYMPKWGFINTSGEIVIPAQYSRVQNFSESLAAVNVGGVYSHTGIIGGEWGFINTSGEVVIPIRYGDVQSFSEGLAAVAWSNCDGCLFCEENESFSCRFSSRWGFINTNGGVIIPNVYELDSWAVNVGIFREGLAAVSQDEKWGFINTSGEVIIPFEYDWARGFSEGLAAVNIGYDNWRADGKWGFINTSGEMVIQLGIGRYYSPWTEEYAYSVVGDFNESIALINRGVQSEGWHYDYQFINKRGEIISSLGEFTYAEDFNHGLAAVAVRRPCEHDYVFGDTWCADWGIINLQGEYVLPLEYDEVRIAAVEDGTAYVWVLKDRVKDVGYGGNSGSWGIFSFPLTSCDTCGNYPCECLCEDCGEQLCVCCDCRNCNSCGFLGGRFGFGRVTAGGNTPNDRPTVTDALAILRHLVRLSSPIQTCADSRAAANITNPGSGNPTVQDALQILRFLVRLSSPRLDEVYPR
jgi:hypothetical protein